MDTEAKAAKIHEALQEIGHLGRAYSGDGRMGCVCPYPGVGRRPLRGSIAAHVVTVAEERDLSRELWCESVT